MNTHSAPKVTEQLIDSKILNTAFHLFEEIQTTICILTLENGFTVTGESACVSPENFNAGIGKDIAFNNAKDKIWVLEGYLLKESIYVKKEVETDLVYEYQQFDEKSNKLYQEQGTQTHVPTLCYLRKQRKCIEKYKKILYNRMIDEGIFDQITAIGL